MSKNEDLLIYSWLVSVIYSLSPIFLTVAFVMARKSAKIAWVFSLLSMAIIMIPAIILIEIGSIIVFLIELSIAIAFRKSSPKYPQLAKTIVTDTLKYSKSEHALGRSVDTYRIMMTINVGTILFSLVSAIAGTANAEFCQMDSATLTQCSAGMSQPFNINGKLKVITHTQWYDASNIANNINFKYTLSDGANYTSPSCCGPTDYCANTYQVCTTCLDVTTVSAGVTYDGVTSGGQCNGQGHGLAISVGLGVTLGPIVPVLSVGYVRTLVTTHCPPLPVTIAAGTPLSERRTLDLSNSVREWHVSSTMRQSSYQYCDVESQVCTDIPIDEASSLFTMYLNHGEPTDELEEADYVITIPVTPNVQVNDIEMKWGPSFIPHFSDYTSSSCLDAFVPAPGVTNFNTQVPKFNSSMNNMVVVKRIEELSMLILESAQQCNLVEQASVNAQHPPYLGYFQTIDAGPESVWAKCIPSVKTNFLSLSNGGCYPDTDLGFSCVVNSGVHATIEYHGHEHNSTSNVTMTGVFNWPGNNSRCYKFSNGLQTCVMPEVDPRVNQSTPIPFTYDGNGMWFDRINRSDMCDFDTVILQKVITITTNGPYPCLMSGDLVSGLFAAEISQSVIMTSGIYIQTTSYGYLVVTPNISSWTHQRTNHITGRTTYANITDAPMAMPKCDLSANDVCGIEPLCRICFNKASKACEEVRFINNDCDSGDSSSLGYFIYVLFYLGLTIVILAPIYVLISAHRESNYYSSKGLA